MPNSDIFSIILNILSSFLISSFIIYSWYDCLNHPNNLNLLKRTFLTVLIALVITIWNFVEPKPIRIIGAFLFQIIICNLLVTKDIKKSISLVLISQIIIWISEFSFVITLSIIDVSSIDLLTIDPKMFLVLNIYIAIISFAIQRTKLPKKVNQMLNSQQTSYKNSDTIIFSSIIILIIVISTTESYMNLPTTIVLITNVIMGIFFITIIVMSSKIKANYNKINSKYETSISSLKEYEVMIDKFRVDTHENKNEFLTIRNMIKDNNDKDTVVKYIDKLVDNKIKDNDKIMKKTAKIPEGGLRATVYSKLCLMDKLKIKYNLTISREVRTTDLINLDEDLVLKICKILGVFLDNAIEAVKKLKKKEISIEMYTLEDSLCIDITNNFKGNLDLDKISNAKYTTKGDGHGYGLTLVNNILSEEQGILENEKSINRDTFTQTLKIKM